MPRIQLTCLTCSKAFSGKLSENRKFCSRSCSAQFNNKAFPKRKKIERECVSCKSKYIPKNKSIICENCALIKEERINKNLEMTISKIKEIHGKKWSVVVRTNVGFSRISTKNQPCQYCGTEENIERAHIIQITDAPNNMKMKELHSLENILFLCPNHHSLFDKHKLLLESIPMRDGQEFRMSRNNAEIKYVNNPKNTFALCNSYDETKPHCEFCKKNFSPSKYQLNKLRKGLKIFCSYSCSCSFSTMKVSSKCKERTIEYYTSLPSLKNLHNSSKFAHIRLFNRTWNKHLLTQPCKFCGSTDSIELAHIKAISSFPKETKLEVVNNPNNVIPLCSNCHKKFDSKQIITSF